MQWTDEGVILGTRRHGETSAIVELFTMAHGRHLGLVRGGRSKRNQVVLQPGNGVTATWRARLDEHLGLYVIEADRTRAATLMASAHALYVFAVLAAHLRLLPERDPHPALYQRFLAVLDDVAEPLAGAAALARFELALLADLGFGLDLAECAATGAQQELIFVSPRSGRAVSRRAGEPFGDRLLPLPAFLRDDRADAAAPSEIAEGFALTAFFLARHVHEPRRLTAPAERQRIVDMVSQQVRGS